MPIDNTLVDEPDPQAAPPAGGTLQAVLPQSPVGQNQDRSDELPAARQPTQHEAADETNAGGKPRPAEEHSGDPPPQIPGYQVLDCLGRGAMGSVYRARQQKLDRQVAIKLIELGPQPKPEDVLRFQIEAESLASLQHADAVQVYEVGEYRGRLYLVMELVGGSSLEKLLDESRLPVERAVEIAERIARASHAMHLRGIVHRDLKPANILIDAAGEPKLADFGVAKRSDADCRVTRDGAIIGTPAYMSPEQAEGRSRDVGPQSDVFSLGVILYEMLTGQTPFVGETVMSTLDLIRHAEPLAPSRLDRRLPRDLETICLKCLEKRADRRYESAAALADDLRRYQRGEPVSARPLGVAGWTVKWCKRHPALAVTIALLAVSIVGGLLSAVGHHRAILAERNATQRYFHLSQEAIEVLLAEVAEEAPAATSHAAETRRDLLAAARKFYGELLAEYRRSGRTPMAIAQAQSRLGDIERWLGNQSKSRRLYQQATTALATVEQDRSRRTKTPRHWLGESLYGEGEACRAEGNFDEAVSLISRAIAVQQSLTSQWPKDLELAADLANSHYRLALCYQETHDLKAARDELNQAISLLDEAVSKEGAEHRHMLIAARSHVTLGHVLKELKDHAKVDGAYGRAKELYARMIEDDPHESHLQAEHADVAQAASL